MFFLRGHPRMIESHLEQSGAAHFHGVIYECLDLFYKSHCVRQSGMVVERGFVLPAGMDVEQTRIADGAESVDGEATGFLPRWIQDFLDAGSDRVLQSFLGVEADEDNEF
jgi:hypothetical protein